MKVVNEKMIEYAQSDIYCRKDGFYAFRYRAGLYENKHGALVDCLTDFAQEHSYKGIHPFDLRDVVAADYNEFLLSEKERLSNKNSLIQGLGESLFQKACNIDNGILGDKLLSLKKKKGRELSDEETFDACINLSYSNPHDYWDACTSILELDTHNTSFPYFRELVESLSGCEGFPSQEDFDSFMESIRNDSHTDHVIAQNDSYELILNYHDGFYFVSVLYDDEFPIYDYQFHNDEDARFLEKDSEQSLSGCWNKHFDSDLCPRRQQDNEPKSFPIDGLHKAFERFKEDGCHGMCGEWEFERVIIPDRSTSVRTQWVASFQHQAVAKCCMVILPTHISGYEDLKRIGNISDKSFSDFCDIITSFDPHRYRMALSERALIAEHNKFL